MERKLDLLILLVGLLCVVVISVAVEFWESLEVLARIMRALRLTR